MGNAVLIDRLLRGAGLRRRSEVEPSLGDAPRGPGSRTAVALLSVCASVSMASQFSAAPAAAAAAPRIMGVVTTAPSTTLPTSFQLRRANGMMATVNVPATAAVVLRYGGPSTPTTITTGDHLVLFGQFEPGNAIFDATRVQDVNAERVAGSTRAVVSSVNPAANSITARVTGFNRSGLPGGSVTIDVAPGATVSFANGTTVPALSLRSGDVLSVGGLYNTRSHTLLTVSSMRGVRLVASAPPSLSPIAVTLRGSAYRRQHYVTVHIHAVANASIRVLLRFGGRRRVFTGRAGIRGYYTTRRLLAYGYWPRPRLVQAVVFVSVGTQRARAATRAYIA